MTVTARATTAKMNRKYDTALRIAIWTLIVFCVAAVAYFLLHGQYMEAGVFVLGAGQNVCNLILLKETEL